MIKRKTIANKGREDELSCFEQQLYDRMADGMRTKRRDVVLRWLLSRQKRGAKRLIRNDAPFAPWTVRFFIDCGFCRQSVENSSATNQ